MNTLLNSDLPQSDDLDAILNAPLRTTAPGGPANDGIFVENCKKCRGSGRFYSSVTGRTVGNCFTCSGSGKQTFKQPAAKRAQARQSAANRKAAVAQGWAEENPVAAHWLAAATSNFAASLREGLARYGSLTENQTLAVLKCVAQDEERAAAKALEAARVVTEAPVVAQADALTGALQNALAAGLKRPKLRFSCFVASLAPATGKNPGAVYLKSGDEYLGKVKEGRLQVAYGVAADTAAQLRDALVDPLAGAVAYGRETGSCSCCGRELTDPVSIAAGIGPICAGRFGF